MIASGGHSATTGHGAFTDEGGFLGSDLRFSHGISSTCHAALIA